MKVQGLAVAALSLLALTVAARAEEPTFRFMPEPDFEAIVVKAVEPLKANDAFAGLAQCAVVDARTYVRPTASQALKMLTPCFKAVETRYGQTIRLETLSTPKEGSLSVEAEGLAVYVPEQLGAVSPLMRDLEHALSSRSGRILGQPVVIRREVASPSDNKPVTSPNALTISALQRTIDGCYTTQVIRRIATSEDFIASYGRCIVSDPNLRVRDIRPARPMGVTLESGAEEAVVRTLNGQVRVFGGDGPVTLSVTAYPTLNALK